MKTTKNLALLVITLVSLFSSIERVNAQYCVNYSSASFVNSLNCEIQICTIGHWVCPEGSNFLSVGLTSCSGCATLGPNQSADLNLCFSNADCEYGDCLFQTEISISLCGEVFSYVYPSSLQTGSQTVPLGILPACCGGDGEKQLFIYYTPGKYSPIVFIQ